MSSNKKAVTAGIWYVISNALTKGLALFTLPIFSRILTTEQFGMVDNFNSWKSILVTIVSLDLYASILRAKIEYEEQLDSYLSSILSLATLSSVFFFILTKVWNEQFQQWMGLDKQLLNIMCFYILFYCAFIFIQTKHRACMEYKNLTILSMINTVGSLGLSLAFVLLLEDKAYGKILGDTLPMILLAGAIYVMIFAKGKTAFSWDYWKFGLSFSLPLIPHHLAGNVLSQFDRVMITNMLGFQYTGLYGMAYKVALTLTIVWSSFNSAWSPWFYDKMKSENYKEIYEYSKPYVLTFWLINIIVLAIAPEILKLLAPPEYYSGVYVIPFVLMGIFFQFIYSLYVNIQFYHKKTKYVPIGTLISALVNIGLNYLLIPIYGFIAAAVTTLIGYLILFLLHRYFSRKVEQKKLFNERFITTVILANSLLTGIYLVLYSTLLWRYLFTIGLILIIGLNNKELMSKAYLNILKKKKRKS